MTVRKFTKDGQIVCNIDDETVVKVEADEFDPEVTNDIVDDEDIAVQHKYEIVAHMSGDARTEVFHHNRHISKDTLIEKGIHLDPFDWHVIQVDVQRKTDEFRLFDVVDKQPIDPAEYFIKEGKFDMLDLEPYEKVILQSEDQTSLDRFMFGGPE